MGTTETKQSERERQLDHEIEMYRNAATAALDQLEWAIHYLNRMQKSQLAAALDRNRTYITKTMR